MFKHRLETAAASAFASLGFCLLVPSAASATQLNVPSQFATIQAAVNAASDGDTILVQPGTYNENIVFNGKNVTVQSAAGPVGTTIHGAGGTVITIGPNGALIGFTITGGTATFGAGLSAEGTGSVIRGNIFDGNSEGSGGFGAAIAGNNGSPIIDRNLFRNNSCDGQFLSGVVSFVNGSSPVITNNIFENNPCRAVQMTLPVGNTPSVINNTMVGNSGGGVRVDTRIPTSLQIFRNNILVGNAVGLLTEFGSPADAPTWTNNLVFNNTTNYSGIADQTGLNGNISASPDFVNQVGLDFHLQAGSPAIGAGSPLGAPSADFDGVTRGPSIDIGAFQFAPPASMFDTCLEGPGGVLQINSKTGAYRFTRCTDGFVLTGTGRVSVVNYVLSLTDSKPDRNIRAAVFLTQLTGSAVVQVLLAPGLSQVTTIAGRVPTNQTCACGASSPPFNVGSNNGGSGSGTQPGSTMTTDNFGRAVTMIDPSNHVILLK